MGADIESRTCNGIDLQKVKVGGSLLLRDTTIKKGQLNLAGSKIEGQVSINTIKIEDSNANYSLIAEGSEFIGGAILENVEVKNPMSLIGLKTSIQLVIAGIIHELRLDGVVVKGNVILCIAPLQKISLIGFRYESIMLGTNRKDTHSAHNKEMLSLIRLQGVFNPMPYIQFAKTLSSTGRKEDSKYILIEMERDRTKLQKNSTAMLLWRLTIGALIDYGYSPLKIIKISIVMILVFACIVKLTSNNFVSLTEIDTFMVINPLFYSIDTFIPLVDLKQANFWIPDWTVTPLLAISWWIYIMTGWIFSLIFAAAVTGLIKKSSDDN